MRPLGPYSVSSPRAIERPTPVGRGCLQPNQGARGSLVLVRDRYDRRLRRCDVRASIWRRLSGLGRVSLADGHLRPRLVRRFSLPAQNLTLRESFRIAEPERPPDRPHGEVPSLCRPSPVTPCPPDTACTLTIPQEGFGRRLRESAAAFHSQPRIRVESAPQFPAGARRKAPRHPRRRVRCSLPSSRRACRRHES